MGFFFKSFSFSFFPMFSFFWLEITAFSLSSKVFSFLLGSQGFKKFFEVETEGIDIWGGGGGMFSWEIKIIIRRIWMWKIMVIIALGWIVWIILLKMRVWVVLVIIRLLEILMIWIAVVVIIKLIGGWFRCMFCWWGLGREKEFCWFGGGGNS